MGTLISGQGVAPSDGRTDGGLAHHDSGIMSCVAIVPTADPGEASSSYIRSEQLPEHHSPLNLSSYDLQHAVTLGKSALSAPEPVTFCAWLLVQAVAVHPRHFELPMHSKAPTFSQQRRVRSDTSGCRGMSLAGLLPFAADAAMPLPKSGARCCHKPLNLCDLGITALRAAYRGWHVSFLGVVVLR